MRQRLPQGFDAGAACAKHGFGIGEIEKLWVAEIV